MAKALGSCKKQAPAWHASLKTRKPSLARRLKQRFEQLAAGRTPTGKNKNAKEMESLHG